MFILNLAITIVYITLEIIRKELGISQAAFSTRRSIRDKTLNFEPIRTGYVCTSYDSMFTLTIDR